MSAFSKRYLESVATTPPPTECVPLCPMLWGASRDVRHAWALCCGFDVDLAEEEKRGVMFSNAYGVGWCIWGHG